MYLTTSESEAREYAGLAVGAQIVEWIARGRAGERPAGAVYEVIPLGDVEADADYTGSLVGVSWQAERAVIVAVRTI